MRVLITGGTGFVGSHAMRALSGEHELVAIGRGAAPAELEHLAEWVRADLSGSLDAASLPDRVDAVIHLAQSRRYADLPGGTEDVVAINLRSTVALRDYAIGAGAERFVYASTGGVYARSLDPIREDAPLIPATPISSRSSRASSGWARPSGCEGSCFGRSSSMGRARSACWSPT